MRKLLCILLVLAGCKSAPPHVESEYEKRMPDAIIRRIPIPHPVQHNLFVELKASKPCATNCPVARSNVVFSWRPEFVLAWNASAAGTTTITNYRIYYGQTNTLTNSFNVGLSLTNWLTNCPLGAWNVAVTAMDAHGLESDKSAMVRITNEAWRVEDWSDLKTAATYSITTNLFAISLVGGTKFLRVRPNRTGSKYVGVAVR